METIKTERAGDDPQPEPAEPQLIGHTADTTAERNCTLTTPRPHAELAGEFQTVRGAT